MIRWPGEASRVIQRQGFAAVEDGKVVVGVAGEADDIADGQDGTAARPAASGGGFQASAARIRSASASHRRVEPSTSVNRNVTTPKERTPPQNLTTDTLLPRTSAESGPETDAPRRGVARYPLAGSQRRYATCWLASGDKIAT
jgi:hypothetical protein